MAGVGRFRDTIRLEAVLQVEEFVHIDEIHTNRLLNNNGRFIRTWRSESINVVVQDLACLRDCGLIHPRPAGRETFFSLADERMKDLFLLADDVVVEGSD